MQHDPVMTDLHQHLMKEDREQDRSEAEEAIIEQWMKNPAVVQDTLEKSEILAEDDFLKIVSKAVASGDWHRVSGYIEDGLKQHLSEAAGQELERQEDQARAEAEEARYESRMANREHFGD